MTAKQNQKKKSDYSFADKAVHHMALDSDYLKRTCFEFDTVLAGKAEFDPELSHSVFVTGLARSGTTILLNALYSTQAFVSLTYRDMPFVLCPNFWRKMTRSFWKKSEKKERLHGDGIEIDFDSPEAFEEVFWLTYARQEFFGKNYLHTDIVNQEVHKKFSRYISNIIKSQPEKKSNRYLSKNNNNFLRLEYLSTHFPLSTIIVTFRNPLDHAMSLFNQHQKFKKLQSESPFL
ncbi:MAG TPA: sulfotransferase, partial [Alphaproteobacteria bacterium]|nr:sulfotransferase [Alphaproteobacteria bacterium]